jgi:hypothetical protein
VLVAPREERIDDRLRSLQTDLLFLFSRRIGERALDTKERADEAEGDFGPFGIGCERFEEVAPRMRPAIDFDNLPQYCRRFHLGRRVSACL